MNQHSAAAASHRPDADAVTIPVAARIAWPLRGLALVAGLAILALLLVAAQLEPDPQGFGTHRQLGLPPCTSVVLWGIRCPSCGMTTAWALTLRGRLLEAASVNAGGFLLAVIAIAYIPASCYFCFTGRASRGGWYSLALAIGLVAALGIAVLQWLGRWVG